MKIQLNGPEIANAIAVYIGWKHPNLDLRAASVSFEAKRKGWQHLGDFTAVLEIPDQEDQTP